MLFTYLTTWSSPSITMLLNMSNSEPGWLLLRLSQEGSKAHHHQLNSVLVWVCIIIKAPQTELSSEPFSVCLSVCWYHLSFDNSDDDHPDCSGGPKFLRNKHKGIFKIPYTYSVHFEVSELSSRWIVSPSPAVSFLIAQVGAASI